MHSYYQQKHPFGPPFVGPNTPININSFQDGRFHPTNQPIITASTTVGFDAHSKIVNLPNPEEYRHSSTPEGQRILFDFNAGSTTPTPISLVIQHKRFNSKDNVFLRTDLSPALERPSRRFSRYYNQIFDEDAIDYIAAVEAADGQRLEYQIQEAIQQFIFGCKLDPSPNPGVSNWDAIKAACFLAGPRTLSGILVPLKGTAPTNVNFVTGDYNRILGLKGNGVNKRLNSHRANNDDPQDNRGFYVYVTEPATNSDTYNVYIGTGIVANMSAIYRRTSDLTLIRFRPSATEISRTIQNGGVGGLGFSRHSSTHVDILNFDVFEGNVADTSGPQNSSNIGVFAGTSDRYDDPRMAIYCIGEAFDQELLNARVKLYLEQINLALS